MDESIVKVFEEQRVGKLKLSQALRIGAALRPKCLGYMFHEGASCALGAIYEATFGHPADEGNQCSMDQLYEAYPELASPVKTNQLDLCERIYRWNDSGKTREVIADKLERMGF